MAYIVKRTSTDGKVSYRVHIRKKGVDISKTFYDEESAKLYEYYKENIINNMENFDVPIENRITLEQLFGLKIKETCPSKTREINDLNLTKTRFVDFFGKEKFVHEISYDSWVECSKKFIESYVYKGSKKEKNKRIMSLKTLKKIFALCSSCISHINSLGVNIENLPLRVISTIINPILKNSSKNCIV